MHTYRLDPALKSLGKRLDNILCDIARLPLSPPMDELLQQLHRTEQDETAQLSLLAAALPREVQRGNDGGEQGHA
jgi:hypothetical protein